MGRSSAVLLLAVATLAGCGGEEQRAETKVRVTVGPPQRCTAAHARDFRLCSYAGRGAPTTPATIQRRDETGWRILVAGPPGTVHDGMQIGHWRDAWLSPDGRTLLAQWSAECEVPIAFFVDARTRRMRVVTGEKKWSNAPESIALGWASDGRARVRFPKGVCGRGASEPGDYLIDPETGRLTRAARG